MISIKFDGALALSAQVNELVASDFSTLVDFHLRSFSWSSSCSFEAGSAFLADDGGL